MDLCHTVGEMDSQERGRLQGHLSIRRCHYAHSRGVLFFLAPRWRRPLELCTPVVIDFVVMIFFINSMEIGGTVGLCFPPSHQKKKSHNTVFASFKATLASVFCPFQSSSINLFLLAYSSFKNLNHLVLPVTTHALTPISTLNPNFSFSYAMLLKGVSSLFFICLTICGACSPQS